MESATSGQPGTLPVGWSNLSGDDADWWVDAGGTPSSQTGPSVDHTLGTSAGKYMYIEASAPNYPTKTATLATPCFDLTGLTSPFLIFWYHMYSGGGNAGTFHLDVEQGGTITSDIWLVSGDQGDIWEQVLVDLSAYSGQITLHFRGITGSTWQSDIALDDVFVGDFTPTYGCMDPIANNYDPAANVDDGSCDYSCPGGQASVEVSIIPDGYPSEISWDLVNGSNGSVLASGGSVGSIFCVDTNQCFVFTIYDSYGDGLCCSGGSYQVTYDGAVVASGGGNYGYQDQTTFNCPPGYSCADAIPVGVGVHTAPTLEFWYDFTPDSTGSYTVTTCGTNTCDTRLWMYDFACGAIQLSDNLEGTTFSDDNDGGCGEQAVINGNMQAGVTYHLRIGHNGTGANPCGGAVNFEIIYNGPVVGCMDLGSCNYEPLATIPCNNCCLQPGDPLCPDGPDLEINSAALTSSIYLSTVNITDACAPQEGCVRAMGQRYVLRFSTRIDNIGNLDYYIGDPVDNPQMFDSQNCHGHNHYAGYADYVLFDTNGVSLPVGFKNGFCVIDVGCFSGTGQYGCSNMGISAGCYDVYGSGTTCNWIDITDVPAGQYTLIVRTNWARLPDALGRHETDYSNNYGQVCIEITRDINNVPSFTQIGNCPVWTDCLGQPYGDARLDCNGVCNGTTKTGDLNNDGDQTQPDAMEYVVGILGDDILPSSCTDLNDDGVITVTDAALMANCYNTQDLHDAQNHVLHYHPWCDFPRGYVSTIDTATLSLANFDPVAQTVDVMIRNPDSRITAYEFDVSGITIQSVDNLVDPSVYNIFPQSSLGGTKVIGISYIDSSIVKNVTDIPLCRIHYLNLTGTQVCISNVVDIVNEDANNIITQVENACLSVVDAVALDLKVFLEGPYDDISGLMRDDLRAQGYLPTNEPFTSLGFTHAGEGGGETVIPDVFTVTGPDAIVDWMLVELRSSTNPSTVLDTRSVLVQRDGDVVGLDGSSLVIMSVPPSDYFVALRHRNHLGIMTATAQSLSAIPTQIDLRTATVPAWGTGARKDLAGIQVMWAGDTFIDGEVKYTGNDNDRDEILIAIGGNVPTATISGYHRQDVDLSGSVKYTGSGNDRDPILVNIGGSIPTNTRVEQLP